MQLLKFFLIGLKQNMVRNNNKKLLKNQEILSNFLKTGSCCIKYDIPVTKIYAITLKHFFLTNFFEEN